MARTSTYLNFRGRTEEAFNFYKFIFRTEFIGQLHRMSETPTCSGTPQISEAEGKLVMHVELPILGGHVLMGTDVLESTGHKLVVGTNITINLEPDTRDETRRLFAALAEGGEVTTPLQEMFWGAFFGGLTDKFGVQWMVNCTAK